MCGIYEIKNALNNHRYIGSSIDIEKRWGEHLRELNGNYHYNVYLQNAWNKYGENKFEFNVLEECESVKNVILFIEQKYLDSNPEYNMCKIAGNTMGVVFTKERKRKIGQANSKRVVKDSTRKKHSENSKNSEWNRIQRKPVQMICLVTGEILEEFNSIADAARYTGHNNKRMNIRRVLLGKRKKAYGYFWKLKKDQNDL